MAKKDKQLLIILRLKDMMTVPLRGALRSITRFARRAVKALRTVTREAARVRKAMRGLGSTLASTSTAAGAGFGVGMAEVSASAKGMSLSVISSFGQTAAVVQASSGSMAVSVAQAGALMRAVMDSFRDRPATPVFGQKDARRIEAALKRAQKAIGRFAVRARQAFRSVTRVARSLRRVLFGLPALFALIGGFAVARLAKGLSGAASEAEEMRNRFNVVFEGIRDEALATAGEIAQAAGRSVTDIQQAMSDFQNLFIPLGFATEDVLQLSTALTQVSIDLTSFQDKASDEESTRRLISGLLGSARGLRELNINLLDSTVSEKALELGFGKTNNELTEQEKILTRVVLILERSSLAQGDAIRTAEEFANTMKRLTSLIKGVRQEIGLRLNVVILEAIRAIGGEQSVIQVVVFLLNGVLALSEQAIGAFVKLVNVFRIVVASLGGMEEAVAFVSAQIEGLGAIVRIIFKGFVVLMTLTTISVNAVINAVRLLFAGLKVVGELIDFAFGPVVDELANAFGTVVTIIAGLVTILVEALPKSMEALVGIFNKFTLSLAKTADQLAKIPLIGEQFEGVGDGLRGVAFGMEFLAKNSNDLTGDVRKLLESISPGFADGAQAWEDFTNIAAAQVDVLKFLFASLAVDFEKLFATGGVIGLGIGLMIENFAKMAEELDNVVRSGGDAVAWAERYGITQEQLAGFLRGTSTAQAELTTRLDEFRAAAQQTEGVIENIAGGALFAFADGLSNAFGAIVSGSKSAKEAFRDFATSFMGQIAAMIARALILRALAALFFTPAAPAAGVQSTVAGPVAIPLPGLATGGVISGGVKSTMPIRAYANGGPIFSGAHLAVIGEGKHNEAVVPLPDGRSIPVTLQGGGGGETTINFNINTIDARGMDDLLVDRRETIQDMVASGMGTRRTFRSTMQGAIP